MIYISTLRACHRSAEFTEEWEPLVRGDHWVLASGALQLKIFCYANVPLIHENDLAFVYLQSLTAASHRCKDIKRVHCAQYKRRTIPDPMTM